MALIGYSIFAFDKTTPFPSAYALLPTVGAALILLFAWPSTWVGKLLGCRVLVAIGLISYSAYLWHQPVFAFARHKNLTEPSDALLASLAVATLGLAYLSWRFVEQPFRKPSATKFLQRRAIFAYAFAGSAIFAGFGTFLDNTRYFESNLSTEQRRLYVFLDYEDSEDFVVGYRRGTCFYDRRLNSFEHYDKATCLRFASDKKNYLLIGDSHAAHLWYGISQNFPEINVMQATASGCRPLVNAQGEKRCTDLTNYIFEEYLPSHRLDGVILSARWRKGELEALRQTVTYLEGVTPNIVVLGPTVEYAKDLPLLLLRLRGAAEYDRVVPARFITYERFDLSDSMHEMFAGSRAQYVPVIAAVCPNRECQTMTDANEPMAWDYGHFTLSASKLVVRRLKDQGLLRLE